MQTLQYCKLCGNVTYLKKMTATLFIFNTILSVLFGSVPVTSNINSILLFFIFISHFGPETNLLLFCGPSSDSCWASHASCIPAVLQHLNNIQNLVRLLHDNQKFVNARIASHSVRTFNAHHRNTRWNGTVLFVFVSGAKRLERNLANLATLFELALVQRGFAVKSFGDPIFYSLRCRALLM